MRLKRLIEQAGLVGQGKGDDFYSKCTGKSLGFKQVNEVDLQYKNSLQQYAECTKPVKSRRNPVRKLLKRQEVMTVPDGMANMEVNRRHGGELILSVRGRGSRSKIPKLFFLKKEVGRVFFLSCLRELFLFGHNMRLAGSFFPDHGLNPCPLQWKHGVLTTGPPGTCLN